MAHNYYVSNIAEKSATVKRGPISKSEKSNLSIHASDYLPQKCGRFFFAPKI
jgi:hypothetical protein